MRGRRKSERSGSCARPLQRRASLTNRKGGDQKVRTASRKVTDPKQAEDALRRSNAIFQGLSRLTPNLLCVKDTTGRVLMANPAMLRFLGKTESEVVGKRDLEFVASAKQAARIMANDRRIMKTGRCETMEETGLSPTGRWTLLFTKSPYLDAGGKVIGVMGIGTDITERKRVEAALRDSEERYRTLIEMMREGLVIVDEDLRLVFVNDSFCRMLGYRRKELLGRKGSFFLDRRNRAILHDQFRRRKRGLASPYELTFTRKDGRRFHGLVSPDMVVNAKGRFSGSLSVVTDISLLKQTEESMLKAQAELGTRVQERTAELAEANRRLKEEIRDKEQIEERLRQSEEKYRQFFATETDAVLLFDEKKSGYLDVNESACRLYGYTREEFLRLKHLDITAGLAASDQAMKEVMRKKNVHGMFNVHRKKDGTVFPVEISGSTFILRGKRVFCSVVRDITERKRTEEALRAAHMKLLGVREEERRRLSQELHDSVGQRLVVARMKVKDIAASTSASRGSSASQAMAELSEQLGELFNEIRQVSRWLYPQTLEALGLCAGLRQLKRDSSSSQTQVAVSCDEATEGIRFPHAAEIALYRIAQEALANALRHGSPRRVELSLSRSGGDVRLAIADDGRGFDTRDAVSGGTGLTSMRERAEAVGARFRLSSKPGRTCVEVRVPVPNGHGGRDARPVLPGEANAP